MSQWPRRTVDNPVETVLKARGKAAERDGREGLSPAVHTESTSAVGANVRSVEDLLSLSTSPQSLLRLSLKFLNTEEARPFLLSDEVEEAMARFSGVPDAVRRTAALVVILGRFCDRNSRSEEGSVPH